MIYKKSPARFLTKSPIAFSYSGKILKFRYAIILFFLSIVSGTFWFYLKENYSFIEALYMAVITISTVGFSEIHQLSDSGKVFTSVYILVNIGIFAYALSAFTNKVIQGEIFKIMHINLMEKNIQNLKGHIIICGYGRYGKEIAHNFDVHKQTYVVIEQNNENIEEIQKNPSKIFYVEGDATQDEILEKAGIRNASNLIAALGDDTGNVFTVLTARQINPKLHIISRAFQQKSVNKLHRAGADHVMIPEQIGGYYMANLVTKPNAVEFFSHLTDEAEYDIGFEEITYEDMPDFCKNKSIEELSLRNETGTNIIGHVSAKGDYIVNPVPQTVLKPGASYIFLGTEQQLEKLRNFFNQNK